MKKALVFLAMAIILTSNFANAQKWVQLMNDPNSNFYEVQKEFNAYWKDKKIVKGAGYKQFKRWEYLMQSRVDANGKIPAAGYAQQQMSIFQAKQIQNKSYAAVAQWVPVGPNSAVDLADGVGRVECFALDASAPSTYWAGTPGGGLWKSMDAGLTWVPKSDNFVSLGISWILLDPTNTNTMYVSTGDPDGGGTASTGVLKSIDGGNSWTQSGLNFTTNQYKQIQQIKFLPGNSTVLFAASTDGIYRSTDAGTSWTLVKNSIRAYDIEFHPTNPSIVYAATNGGFIKSVDAGLTWFVMTSGLVTNADRTAIEVSASAPDNVYCLTTENNSFKAIFKSTDQGNTFTNINTNVYLGAQCWWDLTFKVSPTNQNAFYVGGVTMYGTTDGGVSWPAAFNIHADNHNMFFFGSDMFICNDGGLYRSTDNGISWKFLAGNMQITQFYRISSYQYDSRFLVGGAQDNGTARLKNGKWKQINGGDGMDNAISSQNPDVLWTSTQNGPLFKSIDGGASNTYINGITETGAWVTPFVMSPNDQNTVYAGYNSIWKTANGGTSWTKTNPPQAGSFIDNLVVDWSNPNTMYVSAGNSYFKTTDGGTTWTNISTTSTNGLYGKVIMMDPKNSNRLWAAVEGFSLGNKIFYSSNGGTTWTNVSGTFPDLPILTMAYAPGSNDGIYVGTDLGIFYKDAGMSDWTQFNNGLPDVRVDDLEINMGSGKILAGTYGRGIWESPLHDDPNAKPLADFDAMSKGGCAGVSVAYTNYSSNATSWSWTFPGGTPASSTLKNPTVTYNTNGTFDVTLVANGANGTSTKLKSGLISISGQFINTFPYTQNFDAETVNSTTFTSNWLNGTDDDKDWFAYTGGSPARLINGTGPSGDHTSGHGNYLLFESLNANNLQANLYSPCFNLNIANPTLEYYEHVFGGDNNGELHLDLLVNGTWKLDIIPVVNNLGDFWLKQTVDLSPYANQIIKLRFRAKAGYDIDFALDDVSIKSKPSVAPVTSFFATATAGFMGFTTYFYDQSANVPATFSWSFPGGTPATSTLPNPQVVYNTGGQYNVSLTTTNAYGSNTLTKSAYIYVSSAAYNMNNQTVTDCIGQFYDPGGPTADYFNNDNKTLTIIPAGGQQIILDPIEFSVTRGDILSVYDGTSVNAPLRTNWSGGVVRPSQITLNSGAVTLKWTSDSANVSSGFKFQWHTKGGTCSPGSTATKPIANFSSNATTGIAPVTFTLQDKSLNFPTGWTWIAPGSTTEYSYNNAPKITYTTPGTYGVTLIAINEAGRDTIKKTAYFTVSELIPDVNMFTGTVTTCKGNLYDDGGPAANYADNKTYTLVIQPAGASSVSLSFSQWGLESGYDFLKIYNGSSVTAPLIGNFSATSPGTVTANSGTMTLVFTSDASVNNIGWKAAWSSIGGTCSPVLSPLANFSAAATTVNTNTPVQFTDLTSNKPTSWSWTFAGGTPSSSTAQNPSVIYATAGTYAVSLTASNTAGSNSMTKTAYITVTQLMTPVADFSASPTSVNIGNPVQFTDLTTNTPSSWSWTFTGGTPATSTSKNPAVTYSAAGTYAVSLTASNAAGANTRTKTAYITVTAPYIINMQNATISACTGTLYDDGGPNANYSNSKKYTLVIQPSGATSLNMIFSQWGLESGYDFLKIYNGTSATAPLIGSYSATSPGTVNANSGAMTLVFTSDASVNDIGWKATWTATGGSCSPTVSPIANFSASSTSVSTNTPLQFADLSTNSPSSWSWTFAGGSPASSTVQNPSITYAAAGTYAVSLTVSNSAGSNSITKTAYITVSQIITPVADFSASPRVVTVGNPVQFTDLSSNTPSSWAWSFTGGTPATSSAKNPNVNYAVAGTYAVSLTATNGSGSNTMTKTAYITVSAPYVINMQNATVSTCNGTLYDDGGPNSNYSSNKNYTLVIQPTGATAVNMVFSQWGLESGYDFLNIYDGTSASAPLMGRYSATTPGTVNANSGAMTLVFTSDASVSGIGWKAVWTAMGCQAPYFSMRLDSIAIPDKNENSIVIYPNPNTGEFKVLMNKKYSKYFIKNVTGQIVMESAIVTETLDLNLTEYSKGLYFIQFEGEEGAETQKIIIH
jgi:PKD repeat protein